MKIDIKQASRLLSKGWVRYVDLFRIAPRGTEKQMAALLELSLTERWTEAKRRALKSGR